MKTNILIIGLTLAFPLALALGNADAAPVQQEVQVGQQDTARAGQRGRMRGWARHGQHGQHGRIGAGVRAGMGAGHVGPRMLLGLKEDLELTEEQVGRLEKIHEDHHALMQAQMENMRGTQESLREARTERDWDTLNQKIDEAANLRTGMAKGLVSVEKQTWEVLTDAQREKFTTWQEGAHILQRQRMRGRSEMRQQGMGMQRRLRIHADTTQSN